MLLAKMTGLLVLLLFNYHQASSEMIQPLQLSSIPDSDFLKSNEYNGIKSMIQ